MKRLQTRSDDFWLQGVTDERVTDLKLRSEKRNRELQTSVGVDRLASLDELSSQLEQLRESQDKWSDDSLQVLLDEFGRLTKAWVETKKAHELMLQKPSMYCLLFRRPCESYLISAPWRKYIPTFLILCFVFVSSRLRQKHIYLTSERGDKSR